MEASPWYVLSGGPCAGKTTTIEELRRRGHAVVPEAARLEIEEGFAAGRSLEEIRGGDWLERVVHRARRMALELPQDGVHFFDRGVPDSVAYYRANGKDIPELLREAMRAVRYRKIFLLDLIDFENDEARNETPEQAMIIHGLTREAYADEGYEIVEVPVMALPERVEFILRSL